MLLPAAEQGSPEWRCLLSRGCSVAARHGDFDSRKINFSIVQGQQPSELGTRHALEGAGDAGAAF